MSKGKVAAMQAAVLGAPQGAVDRPEGPRGHAAEPQAPVAQRRNSAEDRGAEASLQIIDTSSALAREIVARPLDYRACQRLEALGVPGRFVAELNARCLIGAARVHLSPGGERWEPEGPDARLLLAVTEGGELADIAAVSTTAPDQIALRTGAGALLGDDVIRQAEADAWGREKRVTVKLVADPIAWLQAEGRAVMVLDWGAALPRLRGLGERVTLECDAGAGARIRALLEVGGLPKVKERAPAPRIEKLEAA